MLNDDDLLVRFVVLPGPKDYGEQRDEVRLIYLDYHRTFDSVNHRPLLKELRPLGAG